ncbi:MAG: CpsD/CapB family tyrosine-protein kinase [Actinomycetes bacterium]
MEPVEYLNIIRRRWILIAVFVLIGLVAGFATGIGTSGTTDHTTFWQSTYTLVFNSPAAADKNANAATISQLGLLATTGGIPATVAQANGVDVNRVSERLQAVTNSNLNTLRISTVGTDPLDTAALATQVGDNLITVSSANNTATYDERTAAAQKRVSDLSDKIAMYDGLKLDSKSVKGQERDALVNQYRIAYEAVQVLAAQGTPGPTLTSLEKPEALPITSSEYNKFIRAGALGNNNLTTTATDNTAGAGAAKSSTKSNIPSGPVPHSLIGGFLGLLAGLVAAFLVERLDNRLRRKIDVELAFELPVLCEVPPVARSKRGDSDVISFTHPLSRTAEAYRALRSSLLFLRETLIKLDGPPDDQRNTQVILVTSAGPSEGKTTTVANLAALFAEASYSVLVINCDFRRPRLHRFLGGSAEPRKVVQSNIPGVLMVNNVVSNPNPNPAEVIAAQRQVVQTARGMFDVVILDTAPILTTNDASELVAFSDVVLIVAQAGKTTKAAAERSTELLKRLNATVAGVALLGTRDTPNAQYYYYATEHGADSQQSSAESRSFDLLIRPESESTDDAEATVGGDGAETALDSTQTFSSKP